MYKIAIILIFLVGCASTEKVSKEKVELTLDEIDESKFLTGIKGAENICLDKNSLKVFISDISGYITILNGKSFKNLEIQKSEKVGNLVLGLAQDSDSNIYAGICNYSVNEWKEKGGAVFRFDSNLKGMTKLTTEYPGINGMTIDNNGQLYFASSNFDIFNAKGNIFKIDLNHPTQVDLFISDTGMANGLYYDSKWDKVLYSDTTSGVYTFNFDTPHLTQIFKPQKLWGLIDDLGTDSKGRVWMSDPGASFVKCFNPRTNNIVYFTIEGLGQASSCRVRKENGRDIIYITELTLKGKGIYDGRGVIIFPIESLEKYL